ncbi:MAG: histidine phosphatase family protein, partial [Gammaproteobacteria bacterium]|nr:histidine phosphatase family protein [Gammaproteobacteria bacterium]
MNLYVLRHAQTNYNLLGLCNDDPDDDVHLTATGIKQAEAAAKHLAEVPLSQIYVSELKRT